MALFWRQGFAATSLDEISAATGLNRPSLYRVFGNKTEMYVRCLDLFVERMTGVYQAAFDESASLEEALSDFYLGLVDVYYRNTKAGLGCLVFSSAIAEAPTNEDIQKSVSEALGRIKDALKANIVRHRPDASSEMTNAAVELALSTFLGLGVQVRAGRGREDVETALEGAVLAIVKLLQ